ncbi:MAG: hypothetical protein J3Q66DRAFT_330599 [Benniella sp.]|nr:MAG: hypothetical protein J3Q66DRAFT_330599 [Benniella sp.]
MDSDSSPGLVGMLVEHHSKTLESVEFQAWDDWTDSLMKPIFTGCPSLKSFKVLPEDERMVNWMYFVHTPADPWVFQGIKELHLHFGQKSQYLDGFETAQQELDAGERMFKQIGKLVHLEALALDHHFHNYESHPEWVLDESFECKWVKELARLDKLRYLYIPSGYLTEEHLSMFIDSSWPLLERVSTRCLHDGDFKWLKARRPWLKIGDLE